MGRASRDEENNAAIVFMNGHHTHSDIAQLLYEAGNRLEGVEVNVSHGAKPFPAIGLQYQGNFFALARGMQNVTLRISEHQVGLLAAHGAVPEPRMTFPGWVSFNPFHAQIDLDEWVEKAFIHSSV